MSGLGEIMEPDFFGELSDESSYLAPTFYSAVGIVATLVIIIIIMIIGYCYFARYLVKRNRLMNRKVRLLASPQDDDIIELEVKNANKTGSVDNNQEEDNVKEQQQQENELCGKDTTPLIRKTDSEVPNGNQAKDSEQIKNIPEGMYATVNKDAKTGNGVAHDVAISADVIPSTGIAVSNEDYAEVKCQPNPVYKYQPEIRTKDRSHTIGCTAIVDIATESEDYSRLVHITQPNPRFSMPLLSDYDRIGISGTKWCSLEMVVDQNQDEEQYATPKPEKSSDYETMNDPPGAHCDTPSPLPSPVMDDPDIELGSGQEPIPSSSQNQGMEFDNEIALDTQKGESPPPLPPPCLEGEESNEVLYDQAQNHYQNVSSCMESAGDGTISGTDGKGVLNSKDLDSAGESADIMKTENLNDGIYESIDQDAD